MRRSKNQQKLKHQPYYKFKAFLVENDIRLREIADLLGHSVQTISMKNNGHAEYSMTEVCKICNKLNISSEIFRTLKIS